MKDKIDSLVLSFKNRPAAFVIYKIEDMVGKQRKIADIPHRHNYYSVIWSFTATGKHHIDFKEYPILPNHIFFVSPRQVHQVFTDPGPTGLIILFTQEFLVSNSIREDFISNLKLFHDSGETPPLPLTDQMVNNLRTFSDKMMETFLSDREMKSETIGAYLRLFLIECNSHCSLFPGNNTQGIEVGRSMVRRFKNLVENHYFEWHQVKNYAAVLNVTPSYLNDVIKFALNESAKDYIQNRLVLETKRLILFTEKSSKEIGYDLGFEDPSHFSKFFKNNAGLSINKFKEIHVSQ